MENESAELLKDAFERDGFASIVLISPSMDPLLPTGATAVVEPCKFDDLQRFDLVLFRDREKVICHAVWGHSSFTNARGEPTLMTWGIANPAADDPVAAEDIIGRVVSHELTKFQLAWAISVRLFSRAVESSLFMLVILGAAIGLRYFKDTGSSEPHLLFVACSVLGVYSFTQLLVRDKNVRGRVMALALALSPISIEVAKMSGPWSAIEVLSVFYLVAIWNYFQGERSRIFNLVIITMIGVAITRFAPMHFAWHLSSPKIWTWQQWKIAANPAALFFAVMVAAWAYRLIFRLSVGSRGTKN